MPNYNIDILIQNVRKLMEDNNITQQQLADILDMSQSNVSKALSASDKKNFTLDQVAGIAKHFQVSIDMLVGNYHAQDRDIKPRAICEYLVRLIEHDDIKVFCHPVEEDIYSIDYDPRTYEQSCTHEKKTVNYDAFYFPAYVCANATYRFQASLDLLEACPFQVLPVNAADDLCLLRVDDQVAFSILGVA